MKINEGFILKEVAGNFVVVSCGENTLDFNNIITINETGAIIWKGIETGKNKTQIINDILSEYNGINEADASKDFDEFVIQLKNVNIIID